MNIRIVRHKYFPAVTGMGFFAVHNGGNAVLTRGHSDDFSGSAVGVQGITKISSGSQIGSPVARIDKTYRNQQSRTYVFENIKAA